MRHSSERRIRIFPCVVACVLFSPTALSPPPPAAKQPAESSPSPHLHQRSVAGVGSGAVKHARFAPIQKASRLQHLLELPPRKNPNDSRSSGHHQINRILRRRTKESCCWCSCSCWASRTGGRHARQLRHCGLSFVLALVARRMLPIFHADPVHF